MNAANLTCHAAETLDLLFATGTPAEDVQRLRCWAIRIAQADGREVAGVGDVQAARNCAGEEFLPELEKGEDDDD